MASRISPFLPTMAQHENHVVSDIREQIAKNEKKKYAGALESPELLQASIENEKRIDGPIKYAFVETGANALTTCIGPK